MEASPDFYTDCRGWVGVKRVHHWFLKSNTEKFEQKLHGLGVLERPLSFKS